MKIPWKYSYHKLEKLQKKIKYKKNKRVCRNLQRLLQKTSFIQLLVIKSCVLSEIKCEKSNLGSKYLFFINIKKRLSLKMPIVEKGANNYLFWKIWRWLKKRHRNKSSKWLYNRYWQKSTLNKWIFFMGSQGLPFKR